MKLDFFYFNTRQKEIFLALCERVCVFYVCNSNSRKKREKVVVEELQDTKKKYIS